MNWIKVERVNISLNTDCSPSLFVVKPNNSDLHIDIEDIHYIAIHDNFASIILPGHLTSIHISVESAKGIVKEFKKYDSSFIRINRPLNDEEEAKMYVNMNKIYGFECTDEIYSIYFKSGRRMGVTKETVDRLKTIMFSMPFSSSERDYLTKTRLGE